MRQSGMMKQFTLKGTYRRRDQRGSSKVLRRRPPAADNTLMERTRTKFLPKLAKAEEECDTQFASLLKEAKEEYRQSELEADHLQAWSSEYQTA